jgi:hypothetical protein
VIRTRPRRARPGQPLFPSAAAQARHRPPRSRLLVMWRHRILIGGRYPAPAEPRPRTEPGPAGDGCRQCGTAPAGTLCGPCTAGLPYARYTISMSEMTHEPCGAAFDILHAFDVVTFATSHDRECRAAAREQTAACGPAWQPGCTRRRRRAAGPGRRGQS